jgi:hypothetical protein
VRFEKSQAFHELAAKAADTQRALESGIAQADGSWMDPTRARFETRHLAPIRADARALRTQLEEIARTADTVVKDLRDG